MGAVFGSRYDTGGRCVCSCETGKEKSTTESDGIRNILLFAKENIASCLDRHQPSLWDGEKDDCHGSYLILLTKRLEIKHR